MLHLIYQRFVAQQQFFQEQGELFVPDSGVVFSAGDGKFFQGNTPVQQVPGPGFFLFGHPLAKPVGIEAGHQGLRPDALAPVVQPECGFTWNGRQAVAREMRVGVGKARRVVPHFAGVGNARAQVVFGPVVQLAIGKGMGTVKHGGRLRAMFGPVGPAFGVAAIDAAHGQHHVRSLKPHFFAGFLVNGNGAADLTGLMVECGNSVPVMNGQSATGVGFVQGIDHAAHQFPGGAPSDVVAGHAVAIAKPASLHPVHRRHEFDALVSEPVVHLGTGMLNVIAGPLHRPLIVWVQFAETQPVVQRQFRRIGDSHAPLQRRVNQHHAAKGPQRQTSEAFGAVTINNGYGLASPQRFQGGDNARQSAAGNQKV